MTKKTNIVPEGMVFLMPIDSEIIVRDPVTMAQLPAAGEFKKLDSYWQKRINEGAVKTKTENGD